MKRWSNDELGRSACSSHGAVIEERAAVTAAEVDRVVIGVHQSVTDEARSRVRNAVSALGLESIAYWSDLTVFMVAGRLTNDVVRDRFRYAAPRAEAAISALRERGFIDEAGRPSASFRSVIDVVDSRRTATAGDLWASSAHLTALAADAAVMLRRGAGPLVEPYRALNEPDDAVGLLWHRLIGLRYLRADAHAAAWLDAGLTAAQISGLTTAWRGGQVESPQRELVDHGFLSAAGTITEAGAQLREGVEADTNRRSEPCYQAIGHRSWTGWMAAMAELPPHL